MKKTKPILSVFLAVVMVLCAVPMTYAASSGDWNNLHWSFDEDTLTISGVGAMPAGTPWSSYRAKILHVVIENGVTSIGNATFSGHSNLLDVSIPNTVNQIGSSAFNLCSNLSNVKIPDAVTMIGDSAFRYCYKINSLTIPGNVLVIGENAFYGCTGLVSIQIPNSVIRIGAYAFYNCSSLARIKIPDYVTAIGNYTFSCCTNLSGITIPSGVTSIGSNAFRGCSNLFSLTIPDGVTRIEQSSFQNCTSLVGLAIPKSVNYIGRNAFAGCENLESITIPNGIATIEENTFYNCKKLSTIALPNSVTLVDNFAYHYCDALKDVYYAGTSADWGNIKINPYNDPLKNATIHFGEDINPPEDVQNGYQFKVDTYSFQNYTDKDSEIGHCFGMSMTSSAYYLGILDKQVLGDRNKNLYDFDDDATTRAPICYYQKRQGSCAQEAIVAGGYYWKRGFLDTITKKFDIDSDWQEVVDYVRTHKYDNKGTLQLAYYKNNEAHAVNFLRYEVIDGEERIYIYNNNRPTKETYLVRTIPGLVREVTGNLYSDAIDSIVLRDVSTYFSLVGDFKIHLAIYVTRGAFKVEFGIPYVMAGENETGEAILYELPYNLEQVKITPLVAGATFTYMDESYSFGEIDEDTYGILTLSETEDGTGSLLIENAPETNPDTPDTPSNPQPENGCKWCGKTHTGFFGGLVGFFHRIFAAIFGARH